MSFDAEVEKNKKLMKTIEELRFKKQDLKKTMAKMQKALEKNTVKDRYNLLIFLLLAVIIALSTSKLI